METYVFILNFLLPPRSEQVNGAVENEIKHGHSPEVIVVLDPRCDLSYTALYIYSRSIAITIRILVINRLPGNWTLLDKTKRNIYVAQYYEMRCRMKHVTYFSIYETYAWCPEIKMIEFKMQLSDNVNIHNLKYSNYARPCFSQYCS